MALEDVGPQSNTFNIEKASLSNTDYRHVVWTGTHLQVVLMSIPVGESIGLEVHNDTDQFLRVDGGRGLCEMGPEKDNLTHSQEVSDGWSIQVPAGTWHNVTNIGEEPLQLYTIYAPTHHAVGKVQATKADAEKDEQSGADEPPDWAKQ